VREAGHTSSHLMAAGKDGEVVCTLAPGLRLALPVATRSSVRASAGSGRCCAVLLDHCGSAELHTAWGRAGWGGQLSHEGAVPHLSQCLCHPARLDQIPVVAFHVGAHAGRRECVGVGVGVCVRVCVRVYASVCGFCV